MIRAADRLHRTQRPTVRTAPPPNWCPGYPIWHRRAMGTWNGIDLITLELAGHGLRLRPLVESDAATVHAGMQADSLHEFLQGIPRPYTEADAHSYVTHGAHATRRAGTGFDSAVEEQHSGRMVGAASLRLPLGREVRAELGYTIYPLSQGHGYAAAAARLLAGWTFGQGLPGAMIRCVVRNLAAAKTALNAGFRFEGIARASRSWPGGIADTAQLGRTSTDRDGPIPPAFPALPTSGLTDGVVQLRALDDRDAEALLEDITNVESRRWALVDPGDVTLEWARSDAAVRRLDWLVGRQATMAIVDVESGRTAGTMTLRRSGPPGVGGIGYGIVPAFRGRAFTARALRLVRPWALTAGGFHRLELGAKQENVASQKAAVAGGFVPDGVRQERLRNLDGSYSDEVRFVSLSAV